MIDIFHPSITTIMLSIIFAQKALFKRLHVVNFSRIMIITHKKYPKRRKQSHRDKQPSLYEGVIFKRAVN